MTSVMSRPAVAQGATVFAGAMILSNAGNFVLNIFFARMMTPAVFADANLCVTVLLTLSSIALCLQLVAARCVARDDALEMPDAGERLAATLRRWAFGIGVAAGLVLALGAPLWQQILNTQSAWPFVILGVGIPFYFVPAVGRGVLQGRLTFIRLALSFVIEMLVRLGVGVVLVALGCGVIGASCALTASFIATWVAVRWLQPAPGRLLTLVDSHRARAELVEAGRYAGSVSILLIAQIVANNSDVYVAKVFFADTDAGVYSAIALVGRAVFFLAWSVATVIFPIVARRAASGAPSTRLLSGGIISVLAIGSICALGAGLIGGPALGIILGPAYSALSQPLAAYAAMTTLFAVANLIASYRLSQGSPTESWLLLAASILQVGLLVIWHADLWSLITVQTLCMVLVLLVLAIRATAQVPVLQLSGSKVSAT